MRFLYGGTFYLSKDLNELSYRRKSVYTKKDIDPDLLSQIELESFITEGVESVAVHELWFCNSGVPLDRGIQQILCDKDILDLCSTGGANNILDVYVVQKGEESPISLMNSSKPISPKSRIQAKTVSPKPHNPKIDIPESSNPHTHAQESRKALTRFILPPISSPTLPSTSLKSSKTSHKSSKKNKGPVISSSEDESEDEATLCN